MVRGKAGQLRIVGGQYRGRRLITPPGRGTRPPLDQQREALFNMLGDRVAQAAVADLFAGSGSFGLEALSRGARIAFFVEDDRAALAALTANVETLGLDRDQAVRVIRGNALRPDRWLRELDPTPDIVFMDPPFAMPGRAEGGPALAGLLVRMAPVLNADGELLLRLPAGAPVPPAPPGTALRRSRTMGRSVVHFYRCAGDA